MENKERVFRRINELLSESREFAVVTLVYSSGGSPRKSGARMIVHPDGTTEFSVGGGALEKNASKKAVKAFERDENITFRADFKGGEEGMICGGEGEVFIEVFKRSENAIIFGGGHIALALAKIFETIGMPYTVIDDREGFACRDRFPGAREVINAPYDKLAGRVKVDQKSYCIIVTHGHKGDETVIKFLLCSPSPYIGMIGSVNKVKTVLGNIEKEGVEIPAEKIYSPVGLDIGGETPGEIALSIASEILAVKYSRPTKHSRDNIK